MLIPQRAVREMLYKKFVFVVGSDNKVDMKEVTLGARVGKLWLVEKGLNGDETLVVEGVQKVNKGSEVKPIALSLVIVFAGVIAGFSLPIAQYPNITKPQIEVETNYVGANASTVEESIAQAIEQKVNGVENMRYFY